MNPYKYQISFRINHPIIDPDEISAQLALQPNISWRVGDLRKTPTGVLLKGRYESNYWCYQIPHNQESSLTELLEEFTQRLESTQDFLKTLRENGGRLNYFVGWFMGKMNSGEIFEYTLLSKIANLQIDLSLDIYCPTPEELKNLSISDEEQL